MARPRPTTHHHPSSTTPLRRISHGSLAALSASRSRADDYDEPTLSHLAPVFAELSEAIEDLAVNFEALDAITENLDCFNEGFGGLIYGLRMNAYSITIRDIPDIRNFERAQQRAARRQAEEEEASRLAAEEAEETYRAGSEGPPSPTTSMSGQAYSDATFVSTREPDVPGRGGNVRGRGSALPTRGGRAAAGGKTAAQKKKDNNIKFAAPIINTLPIQYREQQPQRADMETVIGALKDNSEGLRVPDLVKMFPLIPQHRINDALLALVRAKHAIKMTQKGLVYRLDPMKYPAGV